jgi:DNA-binding XRE family transcriptional regulator
LANAVGVTRQTIHSIEKGKFIPSTLLAFKIAGHFIAGITSSQVYGISIFNNVSNLSPLVILLLI